MKRAMCVGINNYPGTANDLSGCVNDMMDWRDLLRLEGFDSVSLLQDSGATRDNFLTMLSQQVDRSEPGDVFVLTYSGHGTYERDLSGDEPDSYDEALYLYDGVLLDDVLRAQLDRVKPGVRVVVILDSCFSGTATRLMAPAALYAHPRFVPPRGFVLPRKINRFLDEAEMVEILMSGCADTEVSYDARIDSRYNGAFTYWATRSYVKGMSYKAWHTAIRAHLPSRDYPQSPQLEGKDKGAVAFEPGTTDVPEDPEPEPVPTEPPKKFPWYWIVIGVGIVLIAVYYFLGISL